MGGKGFYKDRVYSQSLLQDVIEFDARAFRMRASDLRWTANAHLRWTHEACKCSHNCQSSSVRHDVYEHYQSPHPSGVGHLGQKNREGPCSSVPWRTASQFPPRNVLLVRSIGLSKTCRWGVLSRCCRIGLSKVCPWGVLSRGRKIQQRAWLSESSLHRRARHIPATES